MKRKYFGGYVSVRQALYLFLTIVGVCTVFAFLKIDETNADKYFIYILER